jgi:hypothetical protein
MTLASERTIPTERPPLVGEVSANFMDRGVAWSAQRIAVIAAALWEKGNVTQYN